jgi:hypothetical protein
MPNTGKAGVVVALAGDVTTFWKHALSCQGDSDELQELWGLSSAGNDSMR